MKKLLLLFLVVLLVSCSVDVVYADVVAQRKLARTRVQELEALT